MADFRALCAELVDDLELCDWPYKLKETIRADIDRARAALADGPAVPDGREPASVTGQPSDGEVDDWHSRCADLTRLGEAEHYWAFDLQGEDVAAVARAAIARWGNPALQPPAEGEVEDVVRWLRSRAGIPASPDFPAVAPYLTRAADLLEQRHPAPMPVSERLPGPEDCDCDDTDRVWCWNWAIGAWRLNRINRSIHSHWLPAHALPVPGQEVEG